MKSLIRLFAIMRKEFLQLSRDRLTFGMIVGIPLGQLLMFGYAINTDVRNLSAAYVDESDTHISREFIADIMASQVIVMKQRVASVYELEQLLDAGSISIGIAIPDDFDRRVLERDRQAAQANAAYDVIGGAEPIKNIAKEIKRLEEKMYQHARNLEFEEAAQTRDLLGKLREKSLAS
jgi:ABC-2 type transport system permease protein